MTDETRRVVFHLDRDPRLVVAIRSAVQFQALQAGLDSVACDGFAKVSEDVCREALLKITDTDGGIEIIVDTFSDRMEISIHHHGQMIPVIGLECFAIPGAFEAGEVGLNGMDLLACVDRVMFNMQDGVARTTLVKFLTPRS